MSRSRRLVSAVAGALLLGCSGGGAPADPVDPGPPEPPSPPGYNYPVGKVMFSYLPVGLNGLVFFESMGGMSSPYQSDHGGFLHRHF